MNTLPKPPPKSAALRVAAHRQRMREAGLVAKTIWVPDTKDPAFLAELQRECRVIAASEESRSVMAWMEAMQAEVDLGPEYPLAGEK